MKFASRETLLAVFVGISLFEGALPATKNLENDTEGTTRQLLNFPKKRVLLRQGDIVTQVPDEYEVIEIGTMLVNTPDGPKERSTCIITRPRTFPFETVTPTGEKRKGAEGREADDSNEVNQIQLQIVPFNLVQSNNPGSFAAMPPRTQYVQRDRPLKQKWFFPKPSPSPPSPPTSFSSYSSFYPPSSSFISTPSFAPLPPLAPLGPIFASGPPGSIVLAGTGGGNTDCIIVGRTVGLEDLDTPTLIKSNLRRRNRRKRY